VVEVWNSLPQTAMDAGSIVRLKPEIDNILLNRDIKGYGPRAGTWS